jgi:CheY-like chemotaxis protein
MSKKILIVDDFPDYANLLEKSLKIEGFRTIVVHNGEEAIQKAKTEKPDLILLDIMMPGVGGTEVRIELMKDPDTKNIPLLFLTGLRAPQSKKKSTGGIKVIGKSNDFKELLDAIREVFS